MSVTGVNTALVHENLRKNALEKSVVVEDAARVVNTGHKYKDYKEKADVIYDFNSLVSSFDYSNTSVKILKKVRSLNSHYENILNVLYEVVGDSISEFKKIGGNNKAINVKDGVDNQINRFISYLNYTYTGKHIFSGSNVNEPPLSDNANFPSIFFSDPKVFADDGAGVGIKRQVNATTDETTYEISLKDSTKKNFSESDIGSIIKLELKDDGRTLTGKVREVKDGKVVLEHVTVKPQHEDESNDDFSSTLTRSSIYKKPSDIIDEHLKSNMHLKSVPLRKGAHLEYGISLNSSARKFLNLMGQALQYDHASTLSTSTSEDLIKSKANFMSEISSGLSDVREEILLLTGRNGSIKKVVDDEIKFHKKNISQFKNEAAELQDKDSGLAYDAFNGAVLVYNQSIKVLGEVTSLTLLDYI